MNSQFLTTRLQTVADCVIQHVPQPRRLADIGSDHAYLPCYLALKEQIDYAVAGEIVDGPYQSALAEVNAQQLQETVKVRKADGLQAVETTDAMNVVTICGMGGGLIRDILAQGHHVLTEDCCLVLQPNIGEHLLREWLVSNGYVIVAEHLVEERHRLYEIIVAKRGKVILTPAEIFFGPYLLAEKSSLFIQKWQHELKNYQRILYQMDQAQSKDMQKIVEMSERIAMIKQYVLGETR